MSVTYVEIVSEPEGLFLPSPFLVFSDFRCEVSVWVTITQDTRSIPTQGWGRGLHLSWSLKNRIGFPGDPARAGASHRWHSKEGLAQEVGGGGRGACQGELPLPSVPVWIPVLHRAAFTPVTVRKGSSAHILWDVPQFQRRAQVPANETVRMAEGSSHRSSELSGDHNRCLVSYLY